MRAAGLLWLGFVCGAFAQLAPDTGAQNQIIVTPPGWTRAASGPNVVLTPDDAPPNSVVVFLSGRPLAGVPLREAFEKDVVGLNAPLRPGKATPVASFRRPDGLELLTTTVELHGPRGPAAYRQYAAAGPPERIEVMIFSAGSSELFTRYLADVNRTLVTWQFRNAGGVEGPGSPSSPAAAAPAATPERFEAVYSALKYSSYRAAVAMDHYTFFLDGTVCHCLPDEGVLGFNTARERSLSPESVGMYLARDNRLLLAFGHGGTYRVNAFRAGDTMRVERGSSFTTDFERRGDPGLSPLAPHPLEGLFVREDAPTNPYVAGFFIRFFRNGQFQDQGVIGSVAPSRIVNGNPVPERPSGSGTYVVSHYTLRLRYADGWIRQLPITVDVQDLGKPRLTRVSINTYSLIVR